MSSSDGHISPPVKEVLVPAYDGIGPAVRNHGGSRGDSYDNALAESVIGLYKSELIFNSGPWRTVEDVELATLAWVHWWNTTRLHSAIGNRPPAEFEAAHYAHQLPAVKAGDH